MTRTFLYGRRLPTSDLFWRVIIAIEICLLCGLLFHHPVRGADGALDLAFVPDLAYPEDALGLGVFNGMFYFSYPGEPVRRLRADGSLDQDWRLDLPPFSLFITELQRTAWGGWVFRDSLAVYLNTNGAAQRIGSSSSSSFFLQDDGWIVFGDPVSRVNYEGARDPRFGNTSRFVAASYFDSRMTRIGGPWIIATQDSQGRMVVAGNFQRAGELERLGLARILQDGTVDPLWNPAPGLGIELDSLGALNALPVSLATGPEDRLVLGMRFATMDNQPHLGLAALDSDGAVIANFPNPGMQELTATVVQPDGRVLVGGNFNVEPQTPVPAVVRFNSDGSIDQGFNVQVSREAGFVGIRRMFLDDLGRLWISGSFDSVNGFPRAGLARLFACEPVPEAPSPSITFHQPRIGANEFLHLTASVAGVPDPAMQWYLDGVELPGQTNRGLRILIHEAEQVGDFTLVMENSAGREEINFPTVAFARRSPRPGLIDPAFERSLVEFVSVTHLVPLADGSVLVGGGDIYSQTAEPLPVVGKLAPDGHLDLEFGEGGVVTGKGFVESLRLLPDGGILVAGQFTELADAPATGLAELDAQGRLVARDWPELDVAHVSTALRLPDGRYMLAGRFSMVAGETAHRLARLNEDLTMDRSFTSPLAPWQFVDDLQLDFTGRLLIAGARMYVTETMINPPPVGLDRLLEDGSPDPGFQRLEGNVRGVVVEPGGTLLALIPPEPSAAGLRTPQRLDADGGLLVEFEMTGFLHGSGGRSLLPDHRMLRFPDGSVLRHYSTGVPPVSGLIRWHPNGRRDFDFHSVIGTTSTGPHIQAVALLPDGGLLVSTLKYGTISETPLPEEARRLLRIPPDADSRLEAVAHNNGEFRVQIATLPGRTYQIRRRSSLGSEDSTLVAVIEGDGYIQEISTTADATTLFLNAIRE